MKKLITMLLSCAMILSLVAGCGGGTTTTPDSGNLETSAPASEGTPVEETSVETLEEGSIQEETAIPNKLPENYPMIAEEGMTMTAFQSTTPICLI